jgi:uncharacterized protein YdeI (YjbR/CyaY-like superfamily)
MKARLSGEECMHGTQRFEAVLERGDRALGWTIARVPFEPGAVWPRMVRLRVRGEVNGFPFRTSLFPDARGGYYLLINRTMQDGGGVVAGQAAQFSLEPDFEERPAELPEELDALLDEAEGLRDWYGGLTEYTRREIGKWIGGVKSDEARMRRAEQMAERLLSTKEAEVELPPIVERAFRAQPKARPGWERMTAAQRRSELLAVFYYQTPEAREKRVGKLVEAALKKA